MILIVDDDPSVTTSLELLLKQNGYTTRSAASPKEALRLLGDESFRLVLQDMNFSRRTTGEEGLTLLGEIKSRQPELPVILMTAWGSIELAVEGMKAGSADFVTKPWSHPQLLQAVETALELSAARSGQVAGAPTREELDGRYDFRMIVGEDPKLLRILDLVGRIGQADASVLITGESGTGKELLAEAVHKNSKRRQGPFVKVNLGGISSTLFESEMFGHVRGAFTDARANRQGRFELAHGGTIFLDEIGETDPSSQVKLLRVLQDRTYEVLGSSSPRQVDVRVIAATNRNLAEMVTQGSFREDLLYRLNLISVELPPLRQRRGDVVLLAEHLTAACARLYGRNGLGLSRRARAWLAEQSWLGNVRELGQVIERAVLVGQGSELEVEDFVAYADLGQQAPPSASLPAVGTMTLDEMERAMIVKSLRQFDGNVSQAAKALGLSRPAFYRRCERYGVDPTAVGT
jgi:two-component system NtrC family response regulator